MAFDLLILDCDGVILESMDVKGRAFHIVGQQFGDEAADRLAMFHAMNGGVSRYKKFAWLFEEYEGRPATEEELEAMNQKFVAASSEEIKKCELVPGVQSVLDRWHGKVPMYVASGAPEEELRFVLEARGLSRYFIGMYGSPVVKTQLLRIIVQHAGVVPGNAVMVGDSRTDQYAAEAVGTRFYGRGEAFQCSGHPWHTDLTELNAYLEEIAAE